MSTSILLDSTHFNEIRKAIGSRSVAWDAVARSSEVDGNDVAVAKQLESILINKKPTSGESELNVNKSMIVSLIHFLQTSTNNESKKYVTNLIAELFSSEEYSADALAVFKETPSLINQLYEVSFQSTDPQTCLITAFNVVSILIQKDTHDIDLIKKLLSNKSYLDILHNKEQMDTSYVCMRLLQELAGVKEYRKTIWSLRANYIGTIFGIIKSATQPDSNTRLVATNSNNLGIQLQYYSLLLIWLLTFDNTIAYELTTEYLADFLTLLRLVKVTIKEKISRISIAIILQCCSKDVKGNRQLIKKLLLLGNTLQVLQSLSERKYSDEELKQDISTLKEILEAEYNELTSFDEYIAEVDSKLLCWSPPHISNGFWSDNIDKFKADNWKLFKKLVTLLINVASNENVKNISEKQKKIILEVALNDITHVVELLPESVIVLGEMNGKSVIMQLLSHSDSRVKYEALKATQTIIGYNYR
ncbi:hypothetical protein TPHA_0E00600 [Tetrapisispora phaffii CBS 4417]|uniref:V-type proton ATPase subunit H n=1 Tax=Tetrapisispora phaffii (strain ATCC 24235 / CBS 4417 / NBRC 1672 / NRRL Y-8282 / UCD 70-5) TaxID=1071381 RepID=G8BTC7_TETPH|nr:hypothetical protein TPHA_0E00600 [Tetrapisispora phaffii CBS 4417]CCE63155.1 hypothetical protein TPHA_0E00600 [Tetrapisispora phaffii CBS 4417]